MVRACLFVDQHDRDENHGVIESRRPSSVSVKTQQSKCIHCWQCPPKRLEPIIFWENTGRMLLMEFEPMVIPFGWADALNMAHGSISESRKATTSRTHDTARPPMPMYQHRACPILDTGAGGPCGQERSDGCRDPWI